MFPHTPLKRRRLNVKWQLLQGMLAVKLFE